MDWDMFNDTDDFNDPRMDDHLHDADHYLLGPYPTPEQLYEVQQQELKRIRRRGFRRLRNRARLFQSMS